jgi:adenine-specific DNA glycosylase
MCDVLGQPATVAEAMAMLDRARITSTPLTPRPCLAPFRLMCCAGRAGGPAHRAAAPS